MKIVKSFVSFSNWQRLPSAPGVYIITHIPTGREYIGSAKDIRFRAGKHRRDLLRFLHHSAKLQAVFREEGGDNLYFEIVEIVNGTESDRHAREQAFIDSRRPAFNAAPLAVSCLGLKHTPETCRKRSEATRLVWASKPRTPKPAPRTISEGVRAYLSTLTSDQHAYRIRPVVEGQLRWREDNPEGVAAMNAAMTTTKRAKYAKMSVEKVREIRQKHLAGGRTFQSLADEYSLSIASAFNIITRKSWRDVE